MKLYMFRTVPLSIIRSLFTAHSAMVYVIQVCRQLSSRSICSCSTAVYKPVWHIPLLSVQWINSWWWTEELSETCRVSWQNKFVKLMHLVGFIKKKFVTMHGHVNVKMFKAYFSYNKISSVVMSPILLLIRLRLLFQISLSFCCITTKSSISQHLSSFASHLGTFCPNKLYQKDERALPTKNANRKYSVSFHVPLHSPAPNLPLC